MGELLNALRSFTLSLDLSTHTVSKAILILLLTFGTYWLYEGLFLSKTRNIPGPLLHRFSPIPWARLWLTWHLSREIHDLHKKYGPIVRLAPNLVSATGIDSVKKIYGAELWERDPRPVFQKIQGGEFMEGNLASGSMKEGLKMRGLMAASFGRKDLLDREFVVKGCVEKTMEEIVRLGAENGGVVDLYNVSRMYSFSVVDVVAVGGCYKPEGETVTLEELDNIKNVPLALFVRSQFPLISKILARIPLPKFQWVHANQRFKDMCIAGAENYLKMSKTSPEALTRNSLRIIIEAYKKEGIPLTVNDIACQIWLLTLAGMEITAIASCFILWEIVSRPEIYEMVMKELDDALNNWDEVDIQKLEKLAYFNATIYEGLRIHPPIPIAFTRVVPKGGATLNGHFVPEGTLAGVQAYSMCQDSQIFPNPQQYYPSRWIGKSMQENMSNLHMFSWGPRICLGKDLALLELRYLLAGLLLNFKIDVPRETNAETMAEVEFGGAQPKSGKTRLRFTSRH